ncbi:MAG: hypothetical protein CBC54_001400 [Rhizobiales bacterium TMED94]|nr:hypothetical protein [Rhodobiaceae bacterium]RPF88682.1 MAG: hypothetical protein CBC54_001400 [Rhizobiales bacterium TMED94]|tara:strand:- start:13 stop:204 length:192 start_codon:yes stop_codon:yes gene_type:complete
MTPELYKLFLQMAIIGAITGVLGFLSEKYQETKYDRLLMSLTIMFSLIMLYKVYQTFRIWISI